MYNNRKRKLALPTINRRKDPHITHHKPHQINHHSVHEDVAVNKENACNESVNRMNCQICGKDIENLNITERTQHVNNCIDGNISGPSSGWNDDGSDFDCIKDESKNSCVKSTAAPRQEEMDLLLAISLSSSGSSSDGSVSACPSQTPFQTQLLPSHKSRVATSRPRGRVQGKEAEGTLHDITASVQRLREELGEVEGRICEQVYRKNQITKEIRRLVRKQSAMEKRNKDAKLIGDEEEEHEMLKRLFGDTPPTAPLSVDDGALVQKRKTSCPLWQMAQLTEYSFENSSPPPSRDKGDNHPTGTPSALSQLVLVLDEAVAEDKKEQGLKHSQVWDTVQKQLQLLEAGVEAGGIATESCKVICGRVTDICSRILSKIQECCATPVPNSDVTQPVTPVSYPHTSDAYVSEDERGQCKNDIVEIDLNLSGLIPSTPVQVSSPLNIERCASGRSRRSAGKRLVQAFSQNSPVKSHSAPRDPHRPSVSTASVAGVGSDSETSFSFTGVVHYNPSPPLSSFCPPHEPSPCNVEAPHGLTLESSADFPVFPPTVAHTVTEDITHAIKREPCAFSENNTLDDLDFLSRTSEPDLSCHSVESLKALCASYGLKRSENRKLMSDALITLWRKCHPDAATSTGRLSKTYSQIDTDNLQTSENILDPALSESVTNFIREHEDIYDQVLCFRSLDVEVLQKRMKESGLSISKLALRSTLDSMGVFLSSL